MQSDAVGTSTIGFIGLGRMGRPMASNLCRKGFALIVYDMNPIRSALSRRRRRRRRVTSQIVAAAADVILTMLPDTAVVETVIAGAGGILAHVQSGQRHRRHEHDRPARHRSTRHAAGREGIAFADAPVGRLASHAERGESLFMVGATDDDVRARQAAARRDGHDDPSLRRRRAAACARSW